MNRLSSTNRNPVLVRQFYLNTIVVIGFCTGVLFSASNCQADLIAKWTGPQGTNLGYSSFHDTVSETISADIGSGSLVATRQIIGSNPPFVESSFGFNSEKNSTLPLVDDGTGTFTTFVNRFRVLTVDMTFSTIGHSNLYFSFDSSGPGSLSSNHSMQFSLDGVNFTHFGGGTPYIAWQNFSADLSQYTELNNQASVIFRMRVTGGSSTSPASSNVDNMEIGSLSSVPEPTSFVMTLLGLFAVARRRRT